MTTQERDEILKYLDTMIDLLIQLRAEVESKVVPFEPPYTVTE